jgi:hypothetical protein
MVGGMVTLRWLEAYAQSIEERFLSAQADAFTGSEREGKGVGLLRSE